MISKSSGARASSFFSVPRDVQPAAGKIEVVLVGRARAVLHDTFAAAYRQTR
jgi:hypothetical protein